MLLKATGWNFSKTVSRKSWNAFHLSLACWLLPSNDYLLMHVRLPGMHVISSRKCGACSIVLYNASIILLYPYPYALHLCVW